ncbi:hypothetical protein V6N11_070539 [Hibiscus sabdariffa]|uniref:Uncharacterized protein n=1 Tax=Hibiscus sabdariffa TaxID=183260 RepID=A0ABR2QFC3_9ROSI
MNSEQERTRSKELPLCHCLRGTLLIVIWTVDGKLVGHEATIPEAAQVGESQTTKRSVKGGSETKSADLKGTDSSESADSLKNKKHFINICYTGVLTLLEKLEEKWQLLLTKVSEEEKRHEEEEAEAQSNMQLVQETNHAKMVQAISNEVGIRLQQTRDDNDNKTKKKWKKEICDATAKTVKKKSKKPSS